MWQYNYDLAPYSSELYHHGVKGMKWGVRKKRSLGTSDLRNRYDAAKAEKKATQKAYDKSFTKAYNRAALAYSPSKKHRQAQEERWKQAGRDAEAADNANKAFKQVKKERKQAIKDTYKDVQKNSSLGEKMLFSDGTRKKAAKYIVDNNMSMKDAKSRANKDAVRNTAILLGVVGAVAVSNAVASRNGTADAIYRLAMR